MRTCGSCGNGFEAKTTRAKFCSDLCRVRHARGHRAAASNSAPTITRSRKVTKAAAKAKPRKDAGPITVPTSIGRTGEGEVTAAVVERLSEVDRLETIGGKAALALARRIDSEAETGTALAALVKQLEVTVAGALANTPAPTSSSERLRMLRLQRLGVDVG